MKKYFISLGILCLANNALAGNLRLLLEACGVDTEQKERTEPQAIHINEKDLEIDMNEKEKQSPYKVYSKEIQINSSEGPGIVEAKGEWVDLYNEWFRATEDLVSCSFSEGLPDALYAFLGTKNNNFRLLPSFKSNLDIQFLLPGYTNMQEALDSSFKPDYLMMKIGNDQTGEMYFYLNMEKEPFEKETLKDLLEWYHVVSYCAKVKVYADGLDPNYLLCRKSVIEIYLKNLYNVRHLLPKKLQRTSSEKEFELFDKYRRDSLDDSKAVFYKVDDLPAFTKHLRSHFGLGLKKELFSLAMQLHRHALELCGSQSVFIDPNKDFHESDAHSYMSAFKMTPMSPIPTPPCYSNVTESINQKVIRLIEKKAWEYRIIQDIQKSKLTSKEKNLCLQFLRWKPLNPSDKNIIKDPIDFHYSVFCQNAKTLYKNVVEAKELFNRINKILNENTELEGHVQSLNGWKETGSFCLLPDIKSEDFFYISLDQFNAHKGNFYLRERIVNIKAYQKDSLNQMQKNQLERIQNQFNDTGSTYYKEMYELINTFEKENEQIRTKFRKIVVKSIQLLDQKVTENLKKVTAETPFSCPLVIDGTEQANLTDFVRYFFYNRPIRTNTSNVIKILLNNSRNMDDAVKKIVELKAKEWEQINALTKIEETNKLFFKHLLKNKCYLMCPSQPIFQALEQDQKDNQPVQSLEIQGLKNQNNQDAKQKKYNLGPEEEESIFF